MKTMFQALFAFRDEISYAKYYSYASSLKQKGKKIYLAVLILVFSLLIFAMSFGEHAEVVFEPSHVVATEMDSTVYQDQTQISQGSNSNYDVNHATFFQSPPLIVSKNIIFRSASTLYNNLLGKLILVYKSSSFKSIDLVNLLCCQNNAPSISNSDEHIYYLRC